MDDLVGHALGQVGGAAAGHLAEADRAEAHEALGEHLAVGAGDLDGVVGLEAALHRRRRRPGAATRPARAAPGGRRRRRRSCRSSPTAKAIQSLRAGQPPRLGVHDGADARARRRPPPRARRRATPGRSPPARPTRRRSWPPPASRPCPRSPAPMPGAAGQRLERVVDLDDLLDQRRRRVEPGVGGEQARACR